MKRAIISLLARLLRPVVAEANALNDAAESERRAALTPEQMVAEWDAAMADVFNPERRRLSALDISLSDLARPAQGDGGVR